MKREEKKRIKRNKKSKIREKVKEGEMKGHGFWPSPYPLDLPISSIFFILKGILDG
jgi:hypothetical protein